MTIINVSSGVPKSYIDAQDAAEAQNRANADTTLQNNINAEATTRANADTALDNKITTINNTISGLGTAATKDVGTASGQVPIIGSDGKLATSIIPQVALSELVGTVASVAALSGLTAQNGDWAVVEGSTAAEDGAYIYSGGSWVKIGNPDLQFAAIGGAPTDNTALKNALAAKLDKSDYHGPDSNGLGGQVLMGPGAEWSNIVGGTQDHLADYDDLLGLYGPSLDGDPRADFDLVPSARATLQSIEYAIGTSMMYGDQQGTLTPTPMGSSYYPLTVEGYSYGYTGEEQYIMAWPNTMQQEPLVLVTPKSGYEEAWGENEFRAIEQAVTIDGVACTGVYLIAKGSASMQVQLTILNIAEAGQILHLNRLQGTMIRPVVQ